MRFKDGKPAEIKETYDFKIILIYKDRFVFLETDQTALFDRNATPGKVVRSVNFELISLDCGLDGNKICNIEEFSLLDATFVPPENISQNVADFGRKCLVFPIIDQTDRILAKELIYICYDGETLANISLDKSKLSRIIDTYHGNLMETQELAQNGTPRKQSPMYCIDAEDAYSPTVMQLYFHKLIAYKDPANFGTETFKVSLR